MTATLPETRVPVWRLPQWHCFFTEAQCAPIMSRNVVSVSPETRVREIAKTLVRHGIVSTRRVVWRSWRNRASSATDWRSMLEDAAYRTCATKINDATAISPCAATEVGVAGPRRRSSADASGSRQVLLRFPTRRRILVERRGKGIRPGSGRAIR